MNATMAERLCRHLHPAEWDSPAPRRNPCRACVVAMDAVLEPDPPRQLRWIPDGEQAPNSEMTFTYAQGPDDPATPIWDALQAGKKVYAYRTDHAGKRECVGYLDPATATRNPPPDDYEFTCGFVQANEVTP